MLVILVHHCPALPNSELVTHNRCLAGFGDCFESFAYAIANIYILYILLFGTILVALQV